MRCVEYAEVNENMDPQNILVAIMNFDLWILMKVGRWARKIMKLLHSILQIAIVMSVGAGLLSIYALPQWKLRLTTTYDDKYSRETTKSSKDALIGITDASNTDALNSPELERKINHLKNKALSLEMALRRMNSQLRTFHMRDRFKEEELADFASEAAGGLVLETPDTESYHETKENRLTLFGIPLCKPNYLTPRKVIQPWSEAGDCWAFRGDRGNVKIQLACVTIIEQVSLEHISSMASLTGKIDSAPREFRITAATYDGSISSGIFVYNQYGSTSQTFQIMEENFKNTPIKTVILEILSNWGNPSYTCIYRFKVHGRISS